MLIAVNQSKKNEKNFQRPKTPISDFFGTNYERVTQKGKKKAIFAKKNIFRTPKILVFVLRTALVRLYWMSFIYAPNKSVCYY